jgi:hypothetical protein
MRTALRRGFARGAAPWLAGLWLLVLQALPAPASDAELPPENRCPTYSRSPGTGPRQDAVPTLIREGMLLSYADILRLGGLLPIEVWRNREALFHEGMRLEVGPCHRRYPSPDFFREATRRFAGRARLDDAGNLTDSPAGLPLEASRPTRAAGSS